MIRPFIFITAAAFILAGCSSVNTAETQTVTLKPKAGDFFNLDQYPEWLRKEMAREKTIETTSPLIIRELNIDQKVDGSISRIGEYDNFYYINVDIGTGAPMECYLYKEYSRLSDGLYKIADSMVSHAAEMLKMPLMKKYNFSVNAAVYSGMPYLSYDMFFMLKTGDKSQIGLIKSAAAAVGGQQLFCTQQEMGYRDTFISAFQSLLAAVMSEQEDDFFFDNVGIISVNGQPAGYTHDYYRQDEDGDVQENSEMALMLGVDESTVMRTDSASYDWSDSDGFLINGRSYEIVNGEVNSEFSIDHGKGHWLVRGQMQGKKIDTELNYSGDLLSGYGIYLAVADLAASDKDSLSYKVWSDSAPETATDIIISKVENNPESNFKYTMGPLEVLLKADDKGVFSAGTMIIGPVHMDVDMVYVKGQPRLP